MYLNRAINSGYIPKCMIMDILMVDDEQSFLEQAKIFLERIDQDLEVSTVFSLEEALKELEEKEFDGVVSDFQMPTVNGIEFLKILRDKKDNDVLFIMSTGKGREEVAMKALNLGADRKAYA